MDAEITKLRAAWAHDPFVLFLLDTIEQAQKERDMWKGSSCAMEGYVRDSDDKIVALTAQRDAAQKDAKDARALLETCGEALLIVTGPFKNRVFNGENDHESIVLEITQGEIRQARAARASISVSLEEKP